MASKQSKNETNLGSFGSEGTLRKYGKYNIYSSSSGNINKGFFLYIYLFLNLTKFLVFGFYELEYYLKFICRDFQ